MNVCAKERDRQRVPLRQMLRLVLKIAVYLFFHTLNYHHTLLHMHTHTHTLGHLCILIFVAGFHFHQSWSSDHHRLFHNLLPYTTEPLKSTRCTYCFSLLVGFVFIVVPLFCNCILKCFTWSRWNAKCLRRSARTYDSFPNICNLRKKAFLQRRQKADKIKKKKSNRGNQ